MLKLQLLLRIERSNEYYIDSVSTLLSTTPILSSSACIEAKITVLENPNFNQRS